MRNPKYRPAAAAARLPPIGMEDRGRFGSCAELVVTSAAETMIRDCVGACVSAAGRLLNDRSATNAGIQTHSPSATTHNRWRTRAVAPRRIVAVSVATSEMRVTCHTAFNRKVSSGWLIFSIGFLLRFGQEFVDAGQFFRGEVFCFDEGHDETFG